MQPGRRASAPAPASPRTRCLCEISALQQLLQPLHHGAVLHRHCCSNRVISLRVQGCKGQLVFDKCRTMSVRGAWARLGQCASGACCARPPPPPPGREKGKPPARPPLPLHKKPFAQQRLQPPLPCKPWRYMSLAACHCRSRLQGAEHVWAPATLGCAISTPPSGAAGPRQPQCGCDVMTDPPANSLAYPCWSHARPSHVIHSQLVARSDGWVTREGRPPPVEGAVRVWKPAATHHTNRYNTQN